ncbi:MAG TPA: response regulator [Candidatus Limnocylindria bacterium]
MKEGATPAPVVVIAEDDDAIAALVAAALRDELGMEPIVVSNGALVVDAVAGSVASLLVLDVQLPGASGIDVYDVVRNHHALAGIPVLFLTADPARAASALPGKGPREVIAKPFDVDDLVRQVRALLEVAEAAA